MGRRIPCCGISRRQHSAEQKADNTISDRSSKGHQTSCGARGSPWRPMTDIEVVIAKRTSYTSVARREDPCSSCGAPAVVKPQSETLPALMSPITMPTPASPGTNQYRCNACGRYFNTEQELSSHEPDCRLAKRATPRGESELDAEDSRPHPPNDQGSKS